MSLKLVFMGTPEFSVGVLTALHDAGHDIIAVYSQPPRRAGRGMSETKSPVHAKAEELSIPVFTPKSFKDEADRRAFFTHGADAAVVVAYGLILPGAVLAAPRHGCFNVHASALPRWRGAAPIQRAIMAGDAETAAMIMCMEEGLDTGPVCATSRLPIGEIMTAGELHDALSAAGARLMVEALRQLEAGTLVAIPQAKDGITYAKKIDKAEARIDFSRPAASVHNHIRGLSPFPGAWFEAALGECAPERIKALRSVVAKGEGSPGDILDDRLTIACGEGAIRLVEVQRAGKRPASAEEFLRGFPLQKGAHLQHR